MADRQPLPMQGAPAAPRGAAALTGANTGSAQPLSLVSADVDEDGFPDLLVGYAGYISIQRGNIDAFAPQSDASFQAIAHGQFPAPFVAQTLTIAVPASPDFIHIGISPAAATMIW